MASDEPTSRPNQTVTDYVTIALSPALIMGLVCSLVFFLLEVFYRSDGADWRSRLQWILFFFVFGSVLSARVSMNGETSGRAPLYGAILALLTYIGMQLFVEYPEGVKEISFLVNLVLVGVVWWCAHRLTWDCTNVDEETDMSGEGLLQAAGLEQKPAAEVEELTEEPDESKKSDPALHSWLQRYQRYRDKQRKKRTLGVWVVYFSMAALPLFGLGQSLIPVTAEDRRQFVFWLMTVYVGCGLGLLLTTSFLGLRRYLRQKRLQMPPAMTGVWLTSGGTLVVLLLLIGAFLPRPYAEYPLMDILKPASSAKRKANSMAFKGDSPGEGKGQPGAAKPGGKEAGRNGAKGKGKGESNEPGGKSGKADGKDGSNKGERSGNDKGEKGEDSKGEDGKEEGGKGDKENGEEGKGEDRKDGKNQQDEKGERSGGRGRRSDPRSARGMKNLEQGAKDPSKQSSSSSLAKLQQMLQRIGPVLKWIVFAILAVIAIVAVLRGGLGFLANFTDWAKRLLAAWKNFWAKLFGGAKTEVATGGAQDEPAPAKKSEVPFSAYANPFDTGRAEKMPARELVRYTFAAMEAWARERDLGRREDETAFEFVNRVSEEVPALETEALILANLQARAEYDREKMPLNAVETMRDFWTRLERVVEAPLSA